MAFENVLGAKRRGATIKHVDDGEYLTGTEAELQALGILPGQDFEHELGRARKGTVKTEDPRGFTACVRRDFEGKGLYSVWVEYPGFPKHPSKLQATSLPFPAVEKVELKWSDVYSGSGEALVSAGLVPLGHLPGDPGMRKTTVTIHADGSLPKGAAHANNRRAREPGTRVITKTSPKKFTLRVLCDEQESRRRVAAADAAELAWQWHVRSLPRPPRLRTSLQSDFALRLEINRRPALTVHVNAAPGPRSGNGGRPVLHLVR